MKKFFITLVGFLVILLSFNINIPAKNYNITNLKKDCLRNISESCFQLGLCYNKGKGVAKDYKKAVYYFDKACKLNYKEACNYFRKLKIKLNSTKPTPLGLKIDKTTPEEVKKKYSITNERKGPIGKILFINPKNTGIEGVQKVACIFQKNKLKALYLTFPKDFENSYYKKLFNILSSKYKLVKSQNPFVGDKQAEFVAGDTIIILNSPHLSFTVELLYSEKKFYYNFLKENKKNIERKKQNLKDKL